MLENGADWANEPPASIAQNKRIGACHPTRQVHIIPMLLRDALLGAVDLEDLLADWNSHAMFLT